MEIKEKNNLEKISESTANIFKHNKLAISIAAFIELTILFFPVWSGTNKTTL